MSLFVRHVTFDCAEPRRLAAFWRQATGGDIGEDWDEFVTLRTPGLGVEHLAFGRVGEAKAGKNRVHLDFAADDRAAEVTRLQRLGAAVLAEHEVPGLAWTVLADPERNEFCVAERGPTRQQEADAVVRRAPGHRRHGSLSEPLTGRQVRRAPATRP
jgi:predicted enzyme related to lactoylglutathione lyase